MLLIDALFLDSPGGITLLKYLYLNLNKRNIKCFFLLDKRSEKTLSTEIESKKIFLQSSIEVRKEFYYLNRNTFSRIFCFSNIPPPISLNIPVCTFFQNVLLIQDCVYIPLKERILNYVKRKFIYYYRKNTNKWIVQSEFMKKQLVRKMRISSENVMVLPFYSLTEKVPNSKSVKKSGSFIYPSTGVLHKNHRMLLTVWELLFNDGYNFELNLTIPEKDTELIRLINSLIQKGIRIKNHGIINKQELLALYQSAEYLVYPSLNESFGLPLMEAIQQDCKVITADLAYSKESILPTAKFDPYDPDSLKNAILRTVLNHEKNIKSKIIIEDKIDELINILEEPVNS